MGRPKGSKNQPKDAVKAQQAVNVILTKARTTLDAKFDPRNVTGHVPGVIVAQPKKGPLDVWRKIRDDRRKRKLANVAPEPPEGEIAPPEPTVDDPRTFVSDNEEFAREVIEKEMGEEV